MVMRAVKNDSVKLNSNQLLNKFKSQVEQNRYGLVHDLLSLKFIPSVLRICNTIGGSSFHRDTEDGSSLQRLRKRACNEESPFLTPAFVLQKKVDP